MRKARRKKVVGHFNTLKRDCFLHLRVRKLAVKDSGFGFSHWTKKLFTIGGPGLGIWHLSITDSLEILQSASVQFAGRSNSSPH
jgi:hypothetical protein